MSNHDTSAPNPNLTCATPEVRPPHANTLVDSGAAAPGPRQEGGSHPHSQSHSQSHPQTTFTSLPPELRTLIWTFALPPGRIFNALVWVSAGLKMQLLNRAELKMPLAHVCFESRRVVRESGYVLAFRDEDEPDDPGVWFHPRRDRIERTIWGPGDWNSGA